MALIKIISIALAYIVGILVGCTIVALMLGVVILGIIDVLNIDVASEAEQGFANWIPVILAFAGAFTVTYAICRCQGSIRWLLIGIVGIAIIALALISRI